MQKGRGNRRRIGPFESLERRQPLAVDLVVEFTETPESIFPGHEVSYTFRVTNKGDETAQQAAVESQLVGLNDPSWTRVDGFRAEVDLDQLDGKDGFTYGGADAGFRGQIVGDVNADGIDDLLVSAVSRTSQSVAVLFGAHHLGAAEFIQETHLDGKNGFVITGASAPDRARLGDVNGDGIDDVLINSTLDQVDSIVLFGRRDWNAASSRLAFDDLRQRVRIRLPEIKTIQGLGDVNGDGLNDISVIDSRSVARVLFGRRDLQDSGEVSLVDLDPSTGVTLERRSSLVEPAGDFDGDGYDDLILGGVGVLYGAPDLAGESLETFSLDVLADRWSPVGDVNGDGYDDIVIRNSGTLKQQLIFGQPERSHANLAIEPTEIEGVSPRSVFAAAGDVNFDGIDDLLIGDPDRGAEGGVQLVFGSDNIAGTRQLQVSSSINGTDGFGLRRVPKSWVGVARFGSAVGGKGDLNGDGVDDIVVGSSLDGEELEKEIHIVFGRGGHAGRRHVRDFVDLRTGESAVYTVTGKVRPNIQDFELAATAALCQDSSHSPIADVAMEIVRPSAIVPDKTIQYELRVSNREARRTVTATINSDLSNWLSEPMWERSVGFPAIRNLTTINADEGFLHLLVKSPLGRLDHLDDVGDFDGDGLHDFAISRTWRAEFTDLYLRLGGGAEATRVAAGSPPSRLAGVGDFNGDGFDDLALNRAGDFFQSIGILFGGETVDLEGDVVISVDDVFRITQGTSVFVRTNGRGDINGDGYDDVVADVFLDGGPRGRFGAVVFGGPHVTSVKLEDLDGTDGFILEGTTDRIWHIHLDGDINGDGFADLVVRDASFSYVIHGAETFEQGRITDGQLDAITAFRIDGATTGPLGDINGDGFHDILVSRQTKGRDHAYIIFGGPNVTASGVFDVTSIDGHNGTMVFSDWAFLARGIGDFNGDEIDDFLVDPSGATNSASAYLVFGSRSFGKSGEFDLLSLNGVNGFELLKPSDSQPDPFSSTSGVGDINGDGVADLVIGNGHVRRGTEVLALYGRDGFSTGHGDLSNHRVELHPGATATFVVSGSARLAASGLLASAIGSVCVAEEEATPENNVAQVRLVVEAMPLPGDIDLDGQVSFHDFLILASNIGREGDVTWRDGDLDGDGKIGFADFIQLRENFGRRSADSR